MPPGAARQKDDSTFINRSFPRSFAIGQAIQPSVRGQPPKPVCTIWAFPTARQAAARTRGRTSSASSRFRGAGSGTIFSRSNGGPQSGVLPGSAGLYRTGQASDRSSIYSKCSARSFAQN